VSGLRLGPILVAGMIGVPLLEIALFIELGGRIGLSPTLALIVLTAAIGLWILRQQGVGMLIRTQRLLAEGVLPVSELFESLCLVMAGALLLAPGFFTDAVGAVLLVPALRRGLYRQLGRRIEPHVFRGRSDFAGRAPGATPGPTIEAEFEEVEETKLPADGRDMPSPRGDWGSRR
jgi:UPF0716 protein FxsA